MKLDRYRNHSVELVIDRLKVSASDIDRLRSTIDNALRQGGRQLMVYDVESETISYYSLSLMDIATGLSYPEPAPHDFSFNSPQGACRRCKGLGVVSVVDEEKVFPDKSKSIYEGGIAPLGKYKNSLVFWQIQAILKLYNADIKTPISELPSDAINDILQGVDVRLHIDNATLSTSRIDTTYDGLVKYIEMQQSEDAGSEANKWSSQYFSECVCPECRGQRLNKVSLHYFIDGRSIADVANMDISELYEWTLTLADKIDQSRRVVAEEILKEIRSRLKFLLEVGLDYLSLNRSSSTLSGGESQRIRLATQIGSQLINVLYILDEPSIGLHQRDNERLIKSLKSLRDAGNSVIVVEHDRDIMLHADYIVDIGPAAGSHGGEVMFQGTPQEMINTHTLTSDYLNGNRAILIPTERRCGNGKYLEIIGATGHNLKSVNLKLPLGCFICITGVSGSGKSSIINSTLQPILSQHLYRSLRFPHCHIRKLRESNISIK